MSRSQDLDGREVTVTLAFDLKFEEMIPGHSLNITFVRMGWMDGRTDDPTTRLVPPQLSCNNRNYFLAVIINQWCMCFRLIKAGKRPEHVNTGFHEGH